MIKRYLKKYYWFIILVFICTLGQAWANLELPDYMANIISYGIAALDLNYIIKYGLIMLVIALGGTIIAIICNYVTARFGARVSYDLRNEVFEKVTKMDENQFKKFETSTLITRSTNDINQIQMFCIMFFKMLFFTFMMGIGGVFKAVEKAEGMSDLALVVGIAIAFVFVLLLIVYFIVVPKFSILQKTIDKLNGKSRNILNGLLVIRSFNKEKKEEGQFDEINTKYTKINLFINKVMACLDPLMTLTMNIVNIVIVGIVALKATDIVQVGNMMAFMQYAMEIIISFLMISMLFIIVPRAVVSFKRVKEIIDTENEIKEIENPKSLKKAKGLVEFKNVSFKYLNADEYILKDISFVSNPGTVTAFIGSTGSGKSTLINLIPRLYDVTKGEILIDNIDIKNYRLKDLRSNIAFVPQKGVLFSGTISSNIKDGKKNASMPELKKASSIAQAESFIKTKEKKYNSPISQSGSNVSGGQKQRISIARALIKDSSILIFDDSFSALDFKTDANLRKALKDNIKNASIFIVAQRVGTIKDADQIIVLDNGKIVGIGKHNELMKSCEVYQEIAESQFDKGELA